MSKNKTDVRLEDMLKLKPIGDNQEQVFKSWDEGKHQFVFGAAGTGKTFVLLYKAFQDVLNIKSQYDKVVLVRSLFQIEVLLVTKRINQHYIKYLYRNMVQFMFQQINEQVSICYMID